MNKVDSKRRDFGGCGGSGVTMTISNGAKCEQQAQQQQPNIDQLKAHAKQQVNGVLNGTAADDDIRAAAMTKTDTSQLSSSAGAQEDAGEQHEKDGRRKAKKKRNKTDSVYAENNSQPSLLDDFDITTIIRNKYKQEAGSTIEKLKIVINHFEKIELKEDKSCGAETVGSCVKNPSIDYVAYQSELQMPLIMKIIQKDLSEPYSIYTYRYFIHNWPNLCFLAMHENKCVGAIVCKLDMHRKVIKRGYIAMLAVDKQYRKHGLGSTLVKRAIHEMIAGDADEVVLETEITNRPALRLYEALGFVRDKRLFRYYLNGVDALRLKLWLR